MPLLPLLRVKIESLASWLGTLNVQTIVSTRRAPRMRFKGGSRLYSWLGLVRSILCKHGFIRVSILPYPLLIMKSTPNGPKGWDL